MGSIKTVNVSGNVASFRTPVESTIRSLKVSFSPKQSGSGDPSPSNVRPITGWTGVTVEHTGKNKFGLTASDFGTSGTGTYAYAYLPVNTECIFSFTRKDESIDVSGIYFGVSFYAPTALTEIKKGYTWNMEKGVVKTTNNQNKNISTYPTTSPDTYLQVCNYAVIYPSNKVADFFAAFDVQLEPSPATTYEPYHGTEIPVSWQSEAGTVYGGYVDLATGELTVTHGIKHCTGSDNWLISSRISGYCAYRPTLIGLKPKSNISGGLGYTQPLSDKMLGVRKWATAINECTINDAGNFYFGAPEELSTKEAVNAWIQEIGGLDIVYELATPITYQLTPMQLKAFIGRNNIWSEAGTTEVEYDLVETDEIRMIRARMMANAKCIPPAYQKYDWLEGYGKKARIDTGVSGDDNTLRI